MGTCLFIGAGANTLEARSSAERQGRPRQLISQDLPDAIPKDVYHSLLRPTNFVVECVAIIRRLHRMTKRIKKQHVLKNSCTNDHTLHTTILLFLCIYTATLPRGAPITLPCGAPIKLPILLMSACMRACACGSVRPCAAACMSFSV